MDTMVDQNRLLNLMNQRFRMNRVPLYVLIVLGFWFFPATARAVKVALINVTDRKDKVAPTVKAFDYHDVVYLFFIVSDYGVDESGRTNLVQNLNVLSKEGKVVLSIPEIVKYSEVMPNPEKDVITFHNFLRLEKLKDALPPGEYTALISVEDRVAGEVGTVRARFLVGLGDAAPRLTTPDETRGRLHFLKIYFSTSQGGPPIAKPVFEPGQLIYVMTHVGDYRMDEEGNAHVIENLYLYSTTGQLIIKKEPIIEFNSKGKKGVPIVFTNRITLRRPKAGKYRVKLTAKDLLNGSTAAVEATFEIAKP